MITLSHFYLLLLSGSVVLNSTAVFYLAKTVNRLRKLIGELE